MYAILGKALNHHLLNCDLLLCQLSLVVKVRNDSKLPEVLSEVLLFSFPINIGTLTRQLGSSIYVSTDEFDCEKD